MKFFEEPKLNIEKFGVEDIITTSGGGEVETPDPGVGGLPIM